MSKKKSKKKGESIGKRETLLSKTSARLRLCLDGGVEKWEDGKLWEDRKDLVFPHLCLVERVEK